MITGKTFLIWDFGSCVETAIALGKNNKVLYYTPYAVDGAPEFSKYAPGLGYEKEGVEKVKYFFENVDRADCICFFDINAGDIASYLKKVTNKPIFGAGLEGERIEADRWRTKRLQEKLGLNVQKYETVVGVKALGEYLKKNPDKHVKVNIWRGDLESFYAKNFDSVELYLKELDDKLGPFADTYEFMVEEPIKGIELGWDLFFTAGDWVKPYSWGTSDATYSYIGKYSDTMPPQLMEIADKLRPILAKMDYRGAMSIEIKVAEDKKVYLLDICARYPIPMSNLYTESIKNYPELIWNIANDKPVTIEPVDKYIACVALQAEHGEDHWIKLDFEEKLRKYIKTRISAKLGDLYYSVKGTQIVYVLLNWGKEIDKVISGLEKLAERVNAFSLDKNSVKDLEKMKETLDKFEEFGLGNFWK
jgi:hypothetical protein